MPLGGSSGDCRIVTSQLARGLRLPSPWSQYTVQHWWQVVSTPISVEGGVSNPYVDPHPPPQNHCSPTAKIFTSIISDDVQCTEWTMYKCTESLVKTVRPLDLTQREAERSLQASFLASFLEHRRPSSSTSEVSTHIHVDHLNILWLWRMWRS